MASPDIVDTPAQAAEQELPPLIVRDPLEGFLDEHGLGSGPIEAERIGEGHSNVTYLLRRGGHRPTMCCGRRGSCAGSRAASGRRACSPPAKTRRSSACPSTSWSTCTGP